MVSTRFGRRLAFGALLTFAMALAATPASAQEATIFGQVTDTSGAVLPGVTVTVSSPALQVKQVVEVTSASGEYRATPLPIGTYTVEFTLPGFQTRRNEGVRLTAGFAAKVDVRLELGGVAETITVSGQSPVVDVKSTTAGTLISQEVLESVPTSRNGILSLLTLGAGARGLVDDGRMGGTDPGFRAFGRFFDQWTTVDGVGTASPQVRNSANSNNFDYESFDEATVTTIGGTAEAPTAGVQLNVVIKSGGNAFHGSGEGAITTDWMQTNNVDDALRRQGIPQPIKFEHRWDTGGDVGGRIKPDKIWFYASVRRRTELNNQAILFDGSTSTQSADQRYVIGKGTVQLTPSNKLVGLVQRHHRIREEGPGRFGSPEEFWNHAFDTNLFKGEWQVAKGNKYLSVMGGAWVAPSSRNAVGTQIPGWTDQVLGTTGGLEEKAGQSLDQYRREVKGTLSWYKSDLFHGNHDFKGGVHYFRTAADFDAYDLDGQNYRLVFRSGAPFQMVASNGPVQPTTHLDYLGTFFQDSWAISRRLTLNLGIRYANDRGSLPEQCRETAPAPFTSVYPAQCFAAFQTKSWNPVTPRLHAAYDVSGDGKTVIKGGWGRFYIMHNQEELDLANRNSRITTTYLWRDLDSDRRFDVGESNLALNGPDFVSQVGLTANNLLGLVDNPDLKEQGSDEFSLTLERQLMTNFGMRVTSVYSRNINTLRVLNTLRPYSAFNIPITNPDPGPDNILSTADDPGTTITYYDYPASLAGAAFQRPMFINDPASDATYKSIELAANKRLSNRWQMLVSYSATKRLNAVPAAGAIPAFEPNADIFPFDNTWEWLTRASGSYLFPADILVAANLQYQSGEPWARTVSVRGGRQIPSLTVRVEPIGARRVDPFTTMTLRIEKGIRLRAGHQVRVGANILNVFNSNDSGYGRTGGASVRAQSGATFGQPTSIIPPRLGELVVKYTF